MSTESLDPAALAADTLAAADGGLSLEGLIGALASRVSLENLMIQAAVVIAAVVIGKILSRMIDMRMMVFSVKCMQRVSAPMSSESSPVTTCPPCGRC